MANTYFISDTHFDHAKIIEYCNRPFNSVDAMNEFIIKQWNNTVNKNDIVYHLGDFAFGGKDFVTSIVSQLNGNIYLVKGNHDTNANQYYRDCGFKEVYDHPIIVKDFLVLSHESMPFVMNQMYVNLYGHIHDSPMFETWGKGSICLCVERHHYKPVSLEEIAARFAE